MLTKLLPNNSVYGAVPHQRLSLLASQFLLWANMLQYCRWTSSFPKNFTLKCWYPPRILNGMTTQKTRIRGYSDPQQSQKLWRPPKRFKLQVSWKIYKLWVVSLPVPVFIYLWFIKYRIMGKLINMKLEKRITEMIAPSFEVLSKHLSEETEECHEMP